MCSIDWNLVLGFYKATSILQFFLVIFLIIILYKNRVQISEQLEKGGWNFSLGGFGFNLKGDVLQKNIKADDDGQGPYKENEVETKTDIVVETKTDNVVELERLQKVEIAAREVLIENNNLNVKYQWEKATNQIYGTQLRLLKYLLSKAPEGVLITELSSFYDEHLKQIAPEKNPVDNYLGFLKYYLFIEKVEGPDNFLAIIKITPMGINYLNYLNEEYLENGIRRYF